MHRRRRTPSRATRLGLALLLVAGGLFAVTTAGRQSLAPSTAQAGSEALPDLAMAPLGDYYIQWVNGRRLLRFTAMMVNVGSGQFEVRGSRPSTSAPMQVNQVIYETPSRSSPVSRVVPTDAVGQWSGDGHDHWHVNEMMRYDLWGGRSTVRGAKIGFCFLDSDAYNMNLPGAVAAPFYRGSWCGLSPSVLNNRMGISIGWGDEYTGNLAWQWVDITGLPGGTYWVRATVDPYNFFTEESNDNQCWWTRVSISSTSNAVSVLGRSDTCITDYTTSPFNDDIEWLFDAGITIGCSYNLFCTNAFVNREQMATFITRALGLPVAANDYFTDDESSGHEESINRIAEAGITIGCAAGRFCPLDAVRRDQMASFIARAWDLPPTETDYFTDDEGNLHEDNINRVAEAGITLGCGGTSYCPKRYVTRGEMAAFLHRAVVAAGG